MNMLKSKSVVIRTILLSATGLTLMSSPVLALDFQYSFENTGGNAQLLDAMVTGRILGLNDNSFNF